ncbi:MAG: hypothetical protein V3T83_01735, partial [Acidobacteriota bacterium]
RAESHAELQSRKGLHILTSTKAEDDFRDFFIRKYGASSENNFWNNASKSEYLHKANRFLIYGIVAFCLSFPPHIWLTYHRPEKIQKVQLTETGGDNGTG